MKLVAIGPVVSEEKSFEIVDRRMDGRRTCYSYLLAHLSRRLTGQLNIVLGRYPRYNGTLNPHSPYGY